VDAPLNPQAVLKPQRAIQIALLAVIVVLAFLAALHTVGDFDAGWQMAVGRYVVEHHSVPSTDTLSYTAIGQPWIYPAFSGVALYIVFAALGWAGLSWFCAIIAAFVTWLITHRGALATAALAIVAIPLIADRATPRADLFTLMLLPAFLLVLLAARESKAKLWMLPVLMIVWVNTHPGFIFGLALLVWYVVAELVERHFTRLKLNAPWLLATAVGVVLNPFGFKVLAQWGAIFLSPFRHQSGPPSVQMDRFIGEFSPTRISLNSLFGASGLLQAAVTAIILIGAVGVILELWRRRVPDALLLAGATFGALRFLRFQALAAIIIVIVLGRLLDEWYSEIGEGRLSSSLRNVASIGCMVLVSFMAAQYVTNRYYVMSSSTSQFGAGESWWFPEGAAEFIKREGIPGQLFHEYNVGGYVALRLAPEYPDYIDGRGGPFGFDLFLEQWRLLREPADSPAWLQVADRRGINALMFSLGRFGGLGSVDVAGFCRSQNWRPVYLDEVSIVLLRNIPQNRSWIDQLEVNCAKQTFAPITGEQMDRFNQLSNRASLLYVLGRDQEALDALHDAESIFRYDPNVPLTRGQVFRSEGRTRDAAGEFNAALDRKQTDTAWMALGTLLASEGRLSDSRDAMRKAAQLSPRPYNAFKSIGQLSNALQEPDDALKNFDRAQAESPYLGEAEVIGAEFLAQLDQGRAEAWRQKHALPKAIEYQQRAAQRTPTSQKRWVDLARLLEAAGRQQEASVAMDRARQLSSTK